MVPETLGEVLRFDPQWRPSYGLENLLLDTQHVPPPTLLRAGFPPMPKAKQHLDLVQELVAEAASHGIGQRCEKLHVADQMRPAELQPGVRLGRETAVLTRVVATDHPAESLAQKLLENVGAFAGVDVKEGEARGAGGMKAPDVELFAILRVSRAVNVEHGLLRQGMAKFLVSGGQRDAHLLHDLDQVSATELQMQHVVEESLDATVGHVASTLA